MADSLIKPSYIRYPDGDRQFDGAVWLCYRTNNINTAIFSLDGRLRVHRNGTRKSFTAYKASNASPLGWIVIGAKFANEQAACRGAYRNEYK